MFVGADLSLYISRMHSSLPGGVHYSVQEGAGHHRLVPNMQMLHPRFPVRSQIAKNLAIAIM